MIFYDNFIQNRNSEDLMDHSKTTPIDKDVLDVEPALLIHLSCECHQGYRDETSEMQKLLELLSRSF